MLASAVGMFFRPEGYNGIPVNNLDSSSFRTSPAEYVPNLFVVYLRTKSGPQGPKPLHYQKIQHKGTNM